MSGKEEEDNIVSENAVKQLIEALNKKPVDSNAQLVLERLGDLARTTANRSVIAKFNEIFDVLAILLNEESIEIKRLAARALGNISYENVDKLLTFLKIDNDQLLRNTSGAIANLASDTDYIQQELVSKGGVPLLHKLLHGKSDDVKYMAVRALCNIADHQTAHIELLKEGVIDTFLQFTTSDDEALHNEFVNLMGNIGNDEAIAQEIINKGAIVILVNEAVGKSVIESEEVELNALETLAQFSEIETYANVIYSKGHFKTLVERANAVPNNSDFFKVFMKLFAQLSIDDSRALSLFENRETAFKAAKSEESEIVFYSMLVLGNIARSEDKCVQILAAPNALNLFMQAMNHPKDPRVIHSSLGAIRNLALAHPNRAKFLEAGIYKDIKEKLSETQNASLVIQFALVGALKSLIIGGDQYIDEFVKEGGLTPLLKLARGELRPKDLEEDEKEAPPTEKDKRVEYEATRTLIRIAEKAQYREAVAQGGGIAAIIDLLLSKYDVLQAEALKVLETFASTSELKHFLKEADVISVLENYNSSQQLLVEQKKKIIQLLQ